MWIAVPKPDQPGKMDKFPLDWRTGQVCDAQSPHNWCSFDVAAVIAPTFDRGHGSGVGFVITEADPYFFLDADSVLEADGRTWAPIVHEMCRRLAGAAIEVSHSGKGLHWFGRYTSVPDHGTKNLAAKLELYTKGRFVALTGTNATGDVESDHTAALAAICAEFFPSAPGGPAVGWTTEPVPEWSGPDDDEELLRRAMGAGRHSAAAQFGDAVTFADLFGANVAKLAVKWPDPNRPYDASSADMALANQLAFWTGKNCERMERLMRRSALARGKWEEHRTYLADTILKACAYVGKVAGHTELRSATPDSSCVGETSAPLKRPGAAISAAALQDLAFSPIDYVVDRYVAKGLTIFAGRPKLGKSWLVLQVCCAVAGGQQVLDGRHCAEGDVLYCALEDNHRRIQSRMVKSFGAGRWPSRLTFWTEMVGLADGGLEALGGWLSDHPEARLIVVDTFQRVRPSKGKTELSYEYDYRCATGLKELADRFDVAILIVHHTRKLTADDPLEGVSGTNGLTGAADTILVLNRGTDGCTLYGRGRDIEEIEVAVQLDPTTCRWAVLGSASRVRLSNERKAILDELEGRADPASPQEIATATGQASTNVRYLLGQMVKAGEVEKAARGRYILPSTARPHNPHKLTTTMAAE